MAHRMRRLVIHLRRRSQPEGRKKTMNNTKKLTGHRGWLSRLVRLLLTPTWELRMMQQLHRAEMEYDAATNAYSEAIEGDCPSVFASNQAHYWKGRCDALRVFLPNAE